MNAHSTTVHLDADETVRVSHVFNHDAIYISANGDPSRSIGIVLAHSLDPAARIDFLRKLAEAADTLADEINVRGIESEQAAS